MTPAAATPVPTLRILALCILAAVLYGIVHDQITVRVSLEYFTIGHPHLFATDSPTVLALAWGVVATWWVGLLLGLLLAFACRRGPWPRRSWRSLVRPVARLLALMAVFALGAGCLGHALGRAGWVVLTGPLAANVPPERHAAFLGAWWAHLASYLGGGVGGLWLVRSVWRARQAAGHVVPDLPDGQDIPPAAVDRR